MRGPSLSKMLTNKCRRDDGGRERGHHSAAVVTVIIIPARIIHGCQNNRVKNVSGTKILTKSPRISTYSSQRETSVGEIWLTKGSKATSLVKGPTCLLPRTQHTKDTASRTHTKDTASLLWCSAKNAQGASHREERSDKPTRRRLASKMSKS